jgi:hypothetical protein
MGQDFLHRYWFKTNGHHGFGVTAYSVEDAKRFVEEAAKSLEISAEIMEIVEDVDIRNLDENHVVPNMGPPNFRGVWFPNLMLT